MENNKFIGRSIFFGGIIILFLILFFLSKKKENDNTNMILSSPLITVGNIDTYIHGYKRTARYSFHFSFEGKVIHSTSSTSSFVDNYVNLGNTVLNKTFPVIFNSKNPTLNKLLIGPDDFKKFNIPFPDSLQWVKKKLDE